MNEEIRRYGTGVVDITEKARKARLRYYGHVIRRYEGERSDIHYGDGDKEKLRTEDNDDVMI